MSAHDSESRNTTESAKVSRATRLGIAAWPIRRKLLTLLAVPISVGLAAGGIFTWQNASTWLSARTTQQLVQTSIASNKASSALFTEEQLAATYVTAVKNDTNQQEKSKANWKASQAATDDAINEVWSLIDPNAGISRAISGPDVVSQRLALELLNSRIAETRSRVEGARASSDVLGMGYASLNSNFQELISALNRRIDDVSPDPSLASQNTVLDKLRQAEVASIEESTIMGPALVAQTAFSDPDEEGAWLWQIRRLKGNQDDEAADGDEKNSSKPAWPAGVDLEAAEKVRTLRDRQARLLAEVSGSLVGEPLSTYQRTMVGGAEAQLSMWRGEYDNLIAEVTEGGQDPNSGDPAAFAGGKNRSSGEELAGFATDRANAFAEVKDTIANDLTARTAATVNGAIIRLTIVAGIIAMALALIFGLLVVIARSITGPLRRLRTGAGDAAHVNLPKAVALIEREGPDSVRALPSVLPANIKAGPETIEVAKAVDNLGVEAVRLASAQVRLRRTLDDAFISMSRRSQSMVEKQLAIIDDLESTEEDPDQLRNLFRLDHLAARMRRYNDNLLVLAGSAMRTRTNSPVRVAELFRAATSEMEQYERVRLQPVNGASVIGNVAGELIHLLAELLDNAAMYSPPSSPILLNSEFTPEGHLQIEVLDSGVGIPQDEIERLNSRLARSQSVDLQAPSRIGLFVVARLSQRGGFRVSLRQRSDSNGTIARVLVAANAIVGGPGGKGAAPALSAAPTATPIQAPEARPMPDFSGQDAASAPSAPVAGFGTAADPMTGNSSAEIPRVTGGGYPSAQLNVVPEEFSVDANQAPAPEITYTEEAGSALPRRKRGASGSAAMPQVLGNANEQTPEPAPGEANIFGASAEDFAARPSSALDVFKAREQAPAEPLADDTFAGQDGSIFPVVAPEAEPTVVPEPAVEMPAYGTGDMAAVEDKVPAQNWAGDQGSRGGQDYDLREPVAEFSPEQLHQDAMESTGIWSVKSGWTGPIPLVANQPGFDGFAEAAPARATTPRFQDLPADEQLPSGFTQVGMPAIQEPLAAPSEGRYAGEQFAEQPAEQPAEEAVPSGAQVNLAPDATAVHPVLDAHTTAIPSAADTAAIPKWIGDTEPEAGSPATIALNTGKTRGNNALPETGPYSGGWTGDIAEELAGRAHVTAATHGPETILTDDPMTDDVADFAATTVGAIAPVAPTKAPDVAPAAEPATTAMPQQSAPTDIQATATTAMPVAEPATTMSPMLEDDGDSPIFDSISAWFSDDEDDIAAPQEEPIVAPMDSLSAAPARAETSGHDVADTASAAAPVAPAAPGRAARVSRWQALGDQDWLAASARAAASPEVEGETEVGLPRRRPGANLLPSSPKVGNAGRATRVSGTQNGGIQNKTSASSERAYAHDDADANPAVTARDADAVRGRLGSYQRGLANARAKRTDVSDEEFGTFDSIGAGLFKPGREDSANNGRGQQGGNR